MAVLHASYAPPDGERVIGVSHPGHIGDALFSIPAARELARRHGCRADFWTSRVCAPAADLIDAQEFVRHCVVDWEQRVEGGHGAGVQPWHVANMEGPGNEYAAHYHFGFRECPTVPIPEYYCRLYGLPQLPNRYDLRPMFQGRDFPDGPFVCLAARGQNDYTELFRNVVRACRFRYPVVEVGAPDQVVATDLGALDRTSPGFLEMAWIISKCRWFFGLMSAPLVVAAGFDCVKVAPHDGQHWDMRHVIRTPRHFYPVVGWPVSSDPGPILQHLR